MNDYSTRQGFLGSGSEERLRGLCVGIVGLGGGGSHIAQQLAHVGVGQLRLFDPDRIEASNLNRLVGGTISDVAANRHKTFIAARQIRRILPSARIVQVSKRWQLGAEALRSCDLIFGCVDSFGERQQLEEAARRFTTPYIDIGMDVLHHEGEHQIVGQVVLSMPGHWCLRCMGIVRDQDIAREAQRYGAAGAKPQVVWPNGQLASAAVGIAIQLATPWHGRHVESVLLEYDGNIGSLTASTALAALAPYCPHFQDVNSVGDPWFSLQGKRSLS